MWRKRREELTPEETAALFLAADRARWLAEDEGIAGYWTVVRVLSEALPAELAETLEYCWAHADVARQQVHGDDGYRHRFDCNRAFIRARFPDVYEAVFSQEARQSEGSQHRGPLPSSGESPPEA